MYFTSVHKNVVNVSINKYILFQISAIALIIAKVHNIKWMEHNLIMAIPYFHCTPLFHCTFSAVICFPRDVN